MNAHLQREEPLVCRLDSGPKALAPCTIVIFGASGDLTARKLIPALYNLFAEKQLASPTRIIGFARREKTDESWRQEMAEAVRQFSRTKPASEAAWAEFAELLHYCQGEFGEAAAYQRLEQQLSGFGNPALRHNLLFYLAIAPSQVPEVVEQLSAAGLMRKGADANGWQRVVVEKPFGHDLASAQQLNALIERHADEAQVFRIDHYLGKETVQNILMFRFSNSIFEQVWNRACVDHVQICLGEKMGMGNRGGYYEEAGALRDIFQNHLLQVLALVAMEPPVSLEAESIRNEKVKLLKSLRPMAGESVLEQVVRGQYFAGVVEGQQVPGYRQEPRVRPDSNVETFVAVKMYIDNWRWGGVPFFIRSGKRLPQGASEVRVQFRPTPDVLFAAQCGPLLDCNAMTLRLQPQEGISLQFNGKVPGISTRVRPVRMHFSYDAEFGAYTPEAYERLLLEAMDGDATLFIRNDEVQLAWQFVDPIRAAWGDRPLTNREFYAAGTWGPMAAEDLITRTGRVWRHPG